MATWMLSADQQLVNLDAVAYIDVMDVFEEHVDADTVATGGAEPIYSEMVAHFSDGGDVVLYDDEDAEVVLHAFELLKSYLATAPLFDAARGAQIVSVADLMERAGASKN